MNSDGPALSGVRRWLILAIAASGLFLICVDLTVLYVALPALTRDLAASNSERLWILNAYPIVVAGLLPGLGTLGDRYGHRLLFAVGLVTFGAASLAAAYAHSPLVLIAARAGLGVGAAMMMPATLAIIRTTFSDAHERTFAIGLWAGIASGGMALGPLIAGLLLEKFWWGSVFLINVPVIVLTIVAVSTLMPESRSAVAPRLDPLGVVLSTAGLVALTYGVIEAGDKGWGNTLALACMLGGAGVLVLFVGWERRVGRTGTPVVDLALFRLPGFSWG
ncbi:MAG TPA: MFS transporter, partial [Steroidobacteraceae bacterium]|nr:MFS transporter [Steroidobacteraceae bacterium]